MNAKKLLFSSVCFGFSFAISSLWAWEGEVLPCQTQAIIWKTAHDDADHDKIPLINGLFARHHSLGTIVELTGVYSDWEEALAAFMAYGCEVSARYSQPLPAEVPLEVHQS